MNVRLAYPGKDHTRRRKACPTSRTLPTPTTTPRSNAPTSATTPPAATKAKTPPGATQATTTTAPFHVRTRHRLVTRTDYRRETLSLKTLRVIGTLISSFAVPREYADNKRHAKQSEVNVGDEVLLKAKQQDKLSPAFEPEPYKVVEKTRSQVLIEM